MPAPDLDARLTRLEATLVALIEAIKAGAGGMHPAGEHPLDAVLKILRPIQAP